MPKRNGSKPTLQETIIRGTAKPSGELASGVSLQIFASASCGAIGLCTSIATFAHHVIGQLEKPRPAEALVKQVQARTVAEQAVGDDEIDEPIVVEVAPGGRGGIAALADQFVRADFRESPVALIAIKRVLVVATKIRGDEKIELAIVVIIRPNAPLRVHWIG